MAPSARRETRNPRYGFSSVALGVSSLIWFYVRMEASGFLMLSSFFFGIALFLEVAVLMQPAAAAVLPQVSAMTVALGLLTAYGARAYLKERRKIRELLAPRRIK